MNKNDTSFTLRPAHIKGVINNTVGQFNSLNVRFMYNEIQFKYGIIELTLFTSSSNL